MIASNYPTDPFWFDTVVYLLIGVAVPLLLLLLCWGIGALRHKPRRGLRVGIAVALTAVLVAVYGFTLGVSRVGVKRVTLSFSDLPESFDGYRIVQISDLHVGSFHGWRSGVLDAAIDSALAVQADMIALTGDLQNARPMEVQRVLPQLRRLHATDGVYSVLGNHDYPMYLPALLPEQREDTLGRTRLLQRDSLGWHLLCNEHRLLYRGQDSIVVAGMENDGEGRFPHRGNLEHALYGLPVGQQFVVMLEHDPTSWRRTILPRSHTQLTLSGHTHGGQVALCGLTPARLRYRDCAGLVSVGERQLFVSTGVGGLVPFRLGVQPEIVVITLRRQAKTE